MFKTCYTKSHKNYSVVSCELSTLRLSPGQDIVIGSLTSWFTCFGEWGNDLADGCCSSSTICVMSRRVTRLSPKIPLGCKTLPLEGQPWRPSRKMNPPCFHYISPFFFVCYRNSTTSKTPWIISTNLHPQSRRLQWRVLRPRRTSWDRHLRISILYRARSAGRLLRRDLQWPPRPMSPRRYPHCVQVAAWE